MSQYILNPLSDSFGMEVIGLQLNSAMSDAEIDKIENLILDHKVVVFRLQQLTISEQIDVVRRFGDIEPHPLKVNTCEYNEVTYVSNVTQDGKAVGYPGPTFPIWHSDMCYEVTPPKFSFLYAETVPNEGGNTLFANTTKAYDDLDEVFKHKISTLSATFGFSKNLMNRCKARGYELIIDECDQRSDVVHPVIRIHPVTKKKSIFVNWTHTDYINECTREESDVILNKLFNHYTHDSYLYQHQYKKHDLIVWDNSATMHTGDGRIAVHQPRVLRRVVCRF